MNKAIIAAVILVLIGGGLWFALSSRDSDSVNQGQETSNVDDVQPGDLPDESIEQSDQENAQASGETIEVTYTNNGFKPREVTINAGDTVTWTNQSSTAMHVASDDHPVHSDYPGFDQLEPGASYSFTFDQTGSWGYHNHVDPNGTGTITVN